MASSVKCLRHHIFHAAGTVNGQFIFTCWNDVGSSVLVIKSTGQCIEFDECDRSSVQAAVPIAGGLLVHSWCPWTATHFGIEHVAVGAPGSLVAVTSQGNLGQLRTGKPTNPREVQWLPPECSDKPWLFTAAIAVISPCNKVVWTDGGVVRCGRHPENTLLQRAGVTGRPRAAIFDARGRLLLALDRIGKPTTVVQGTFDINGDLSTVDALFTIKLGNVVGMFIDNNERICLIAHTGKLRGRHSIIYRHSKLIDSAPQFYPWTPACNPHKFWHTFTPYVKSILWSVVVSLSSDRNPLRRIPIELILLILQFVLCNLNGPTHIPSDLIGIRHITFLTKHGC